jgi:hypothetical protein
MPFVGAGLAPPGVNLKRDVSVYQSPITSHTQHE